MKIHELREQRAAKVVEMRGLVTAAETAGRDLADNERTRFDGLKAEVTGLDRRIGEGEVLAELERRAEAEPITAHGEMATIEARYSLAKALAEHNETGRLSGLEAEWAAEHRSGRRGAFAVPVSAILGSERRSLTTGSTGGNLVATFQQPTADRIRPLLAVEQLGATVLSGLAGNLDLPKLSASGSASWVSENGNATRTDPTFAKVEMGPKTATAEYQISRRMLLQSQPALETLLRNDLSFILRETLDHAAVVGGGANQPTGLLAAGTGISIISAGTNGAAFGLDLAADLISAIPDGVAGQRGFLTNAKVRGAAMKLKDGQNRPYGLPAVFQGEAVKYSDSVPGNLTKGTGANLSAVIYGAWSDLIVGYWSAVDILPNPYHADVASNGGLLLHAFLDCDVAVRHPESFAALKDVVTQ
ncbi:phage major capsid protein [Azorhizobium doebereinerae]|uniref:phage major capsid protein n=1 Tax=Azorhizobium doebereinerae TaxID=281091 RepID=UPI0003FEC799|nr:phage major capsid protein [Azorhizobium doebereinerae]